ncbi:MAG TPA: AAA family ATPase [Polyangiaceae bacterium]|nr:AAA family ATPase [Polyangiaceae bacterium]
MSLRWGRGLVLGKFMPPHRGHQYLVDFARHAVERLAVVVEHVRNEPIPSQLRYAWMRELCPGCDVVHLQEENPQQPSEHPDFWNIWRSSLERVLPYSPDVVFASESYGPRLAAVLGAEFTPVDPGRNIVPVSGTAIRQAPLEHWQYLPECVRPYFVKRVCIFGPESTGKSTLTRQLADHFGSVAVPEYARTLLEHQAGQVRAEDMMRIVRGQVASEEALARRAQRVLFCDTDPLTTSIWSDVLFGACDPRVLAEASSRHYDLTLLLDVDVPWQRDVVRYLPEQRHAFFERCRAALDSEHRDYVVVRGAWQERWEIAVGAVSRLLGSPCSD